MRYQKCFFLPLINNKNLDCTITSTEINIGNLVLPSRNDHKKPLQNKMLSQPMSSMQKKKVTFMINCKYICTYVLKWHSCFECIYNPKHKGQHDMRWLHQTVRQIDVSSRS